MEQRNTFAKAYSRADNWQEKAQATRRLGLVLGGGGGKGGAHLGVISTLETVGIPIDMMVGTSIGAIMGVLYAAGYTISEIAEPLAATSLWRLMERDPLGMGMLGTRRIRSILENMLGDCRFEELNIPCAVLATDLASGTEVVIDSGPVLDALMGSMALPGIFPPVQREHLILADGGMVNNLPVEIAYRRGAGKVIAVDLNGVCDDFHIGPAGAGSKGFLNLLPNVPLTIANRGLALMTAQLTRYQLAANPPDLLLCPQVEQIGMLEFTRVLEGQTAGEAAAEEAMEQLLALRDWRNEGTGWSLPFRVVEHPAERELAVNGTH